MNRLALTLAAACAAAALADRPGVCPLGGVAAESAQRAAPGADPMQPNARPEGDQKMDLPDVDDLPLNPGLPDPLAMRDGRRAATRAQWERERRPELRRLFQHYMYGFAPPAPRQVRAEPDAPDAPALGGRGVVRQAALHFGPPGTPPIHLMLVLPATRTGPVPVFLGIAFCGNQAVLPDPGIRISTAWQYPNAPGIVDNRATPASRGTMARVWNVEQAIDRGYAVATFYNGDVDPDRNDFTDGVHPHFLKPGQTAPGPHDWGTIAAWAWGIQRAVDYLVRQPEIDGKRIAVVGHSRNGKTALLAAALDDRIALVIPHQSGCGGAAPSRTTVGETVRQINTAFPHWFCDVFPQFNDQVERLPFDQHCLIALVAPRPILISNAAGDTWANPEGQFRMLAAAEPVYRLYGEGLEAREPPRPGELRTGRMGSYLRAGEHSMTLEDWSAFLRFADVHLRPGH